MGKPPVDLPAHAAHASLWVLKMGALLAVTGHLPGRVLLTAVQPTPVCTPLDSGTWDAPRAA